MESHFIEKHRFSVFQDQVLRSGPERGEAQGHVRKCVPSETFLTRSLLMSLDFKFVIDLRRL
jgi:hypothetical protein